MEDISELEMVAMRMAGGVSILVEMGGMELPTDNILEITELSEEEASTSDYELIAEVVEACSSVSRLDLINLYERIIFHWIVGDATQDLRSFSLYEPHRELYTLAPITRLAPLTATPERELALSINGRWRGIGRRDFAEAMKLSSIKSRAQNLMFRKFVEARESWHDMINSSTLPEDLQSRWWELITQRLNLLMEA